MVKKLRKFLNRILPYKLYTYLYGETHKIPQNFGSGFGKRHT